MNFNELKQDAEKLCKELKDKAPADLSVLVLSLSTIINMMITMFSGIMEQNKASLEQNKKQTATISDMEQTISDMEQTISGLKQTISDLQENIKDLQRQLNMDSHNSSKPPSSDGYKKANKNRSLREKTGRKTGGQKGNKGVNMKLHHEPKELLMPT